MATGVFDILHPGHLYFLSQAKRLGDYLVVVVTRDSVAAKEKHPPIMPEEARRKMVEALKPVDKAVLGYEDDMFRIVEEVKPDIIVLGYDQRWDVGRLKEELKKRGLETEVVRLGRDTSDLAGTRRIIEKVVDRHLKNSLYTQEKVGEG
ncbi:MAG: FAD synthase [Thermoplasmata archaeon]|nr:FAD synthase [Thermoplasmata archaeon]